jgi:hypothetical protein
VISVVDLQNLMDLLGGELCSSNESHLTSTIDGIEVTNTEAENVSHIRDDQEPTTIPAIKAEPNVSCVPVVSVTHVSYRLYPELPSFISVCPCETETDFVQFLRK